MTWYWEKSGYFRLGMGLKFGPLRRAENPLPTHAFISLMRFLKGSDWIANSVNTDQATLLDFRSGLICHYLLSIVTLSWGGGGLSTQNIHFESVRNKGIKHVKHHFGWIFTNQLKYGLQCKKACLRSLRQNGVQTSMRMRRLVCTFVVHKPPKTGFLALWTISFTNSNIIKTIF